MSTLDSAKLVFTAHDLRGIFGIGRSAAYALLARHGIKLGGRRLVTRETVEALLAHGEETLQARVARNATLDEAIRIASGAVR